MPAKFLFERIFQLLAFSPHQIVPTRIPLDPKKFLPPPSFSQYSTTAFFTKYFRFAAMHILPTEVPRKWKSPLRETRGQGGGGGGEREGGRWSRCGASEGRRRGRRRKEWGVGRVVSYLGSVVAGSGEGCQVRRVAARVETRERSSEIPSRDIGHSLTRPPTALGPSRNTLACCLPDCLLACLPACLLACLAG